MKKNFVSGGICRIGESPYIPSISFPRSLSSRMRGAGSRQQGAGIQNSVWPNTPWFPGQAGNDTIIGHTGLDPVAKVRAEFLIPNTPGFLVKPGMTHKVNVWNDNNANSRMEKNIDAFLPNGTGYVGLLMPEKQNEDPEFH